MHFERESRLFQNHSLSAGKRSLQRARLNPLERYPFEASPAISLQATTQCLTEKIRCLVAPQQCRHILKLRCAKYNGTCDRVIELYRAKARGNLRKSKTAKPKEQD
jgi:hypothetical protein